MKILNKLSELANQLDMQGYFVEASQIDHILKEATELFNDDAKTRNPPPEIVPGPDLKTTTPPVSNPPKQEKPAPKAQNAEDSSIHPFDKETLSAAREWLCEVFPDQADEIEDAGEKVIAHNIKKYYSGGIKAFIENNADFADDTRPMPPSTPPTSLPGPTNIETQKGAPDVKLAPKKDVPLPKSSSYKKALPEVRGPITNPAPQQPLPGPSKIETNPNQPDTKLPPKQEASDYFGEHEQKYIDFKRRIDRMFDIYNVPEKTRKELYQDPDTLLKMLHNFEAQEEKANRIEEHKKVNENIKPFSFKG